LVRLPQIDIAHHIGDARLEIEDADGGDSPPVAIPRAELGSNVFFTEGNVPPTSRATSASKSPRPR
jgi:hypothetical protein